MLASLFVYLPLLGLLFVVGIIALTTPFEISSILRDTTAVAQVPPYVGALSNLGILMWCGAASACLLTYATLRKSSRQERVRRFFLWCGILSGVLMIDDAFLLHENIAKNINLPSVVTFAVYGISLIVIIASYWRFFVNSDFIVLFLGMGFFAASVLIDVGHDLLSFRFYYSSFSEDVFKLLGIAGWLSYFTCSSVQQLSKAVNEYDITARMRPNP